MKIEEGKYYRRRDGMIVGPARRPPVGGYPPGHPWAVDLLFYTENGAYGGLYPTQADLVEEVPYPFTKPPTPVRTVTRKEIVPGTYGRIAVDGTNDPKNGIIAIQLADRHGKVAPPYPHIWDMAELRAAARLLNEIADAMEEQS